MIGRDHKGALVTLADRASRYALVTMLPSKHAQGVTAAVTRLLRPHKRKRYTVTFDNGKEFAGHEEIAKKLGVNIYFAHPYHSWERGLNENTNGLLRQYFPKGTKFEMITEEEVQIAVTALNHRPRKVLGFRMLWSNKNRHLTRRNYWIIHLLRGNCNDRKQNEIRASI